MDKARLRAGLLRPRTVELILLGFLVIVGLAVHAQYGVPWDETYQRPYGHAIYEYVLRGDQALLTDHERFHGPLVEFALAAGEKMLRLTNEPDVIGFRHIASFLLFCAGVASLTAIGRRLIRRRWMVLLCPLFLVLMPRIWADAFSNTKDLAFLSLFVIAVHTGALLWERPSPSRALLHATAAAALIAVRILGVLAPALVVLVLLIQSLHTGTDRRRVWGSALLLCIAIPLFTVLFWPTLWEHPIKTLVDAAAQMSNYPWGLSVFYFGRYVPATDLPWHYVPVWIGITTPLLQLVALFVGVAACLVGILRRPWERLRLELLLLAWFGLPLMLFMLLRPVVYDGWRHVYFLAPAMALLGARGVEAAWDVLAARFAGRLRLVAHRVLGGIVCLSLTLTAGWMIAHHPQQQVYFSPLIGGIRGAEGRFELDYWGVSYRQLLEKLLQTDKRPLIKVSVENDPGRLNVEGLPAAERARIKLVDRREDADYHLTNYRWHYGDTHGGEVAAVTVDGVKISGAYTASKY